MSGSVTALTRHHGKGLSSICVAIWCVIIGLVGTILFIYFKWLTYPWVTIGTWFEVTLGDLSGFLIYGFSIGFLLGSTPGGHPGLIVCVFTLGFGAWFCCWLVGYLCITSERVCSGFFYTSLCLPLFLFFHCCSANLGMILKSSARYLSAVWCVSFISAKWVFDVGYFNAFNKACADNIAASADDTLGIFTFCGKIPWHQKFFLISFLSQKLCSIYSVPMTDRCTIRVLFVCSMLHVTLVFHMRLFLFPVMPWALCWNKIVWRVAHTPITLGLFLIF